MDRGRLYDCITAVSIPAFISSSPGYLLFYLLNPRAHRSGGVPPIECLPREKHATFGETGVKEFPFIQYYFHVPHVAWGKYIPIFVRLNVLP